MKISNCVVNFPFSILIKLLVVVVVICYFSFFLVVCLLNFNVFSFWPVQLLRQLKVVWRWVQSLSYWITLVNVILKSQCSVNNLQGVQALHLITWRYSKNYGLIKQGFYSKLVNGSLPQPVRPRTVIFLAYKQPSWLGFPFQLFFGTTNGCVWIKCLKFLIKDIFLHGLVWIIIYYKKKN